MGDLPERGPRGFREHPHRLEKLRLVQVTHDYTRDPKTLSIATSVDGLITQFCQEDDVVDEFGSLIKFRWRVVTEEGRETTFGKVSTPIEAHVKAQTILGEPVPMIAEVIRLEPEDKK